MSASDGVQPAATVVASGWLVFDQMPDRQNTIPSPPRPWLLVVFLLAASLRVGWVLARYPGQQAAVLEYPDEEALCLVARSLATGEGLVDEFGFRATYMPGYPVFLALFQSLSQPLFWARLVQAILSAAVAPATMLLAWRWAWLAFDHAPRCQGLASTGANGRWVAGPWFPRLAGVAAAVDPFLVFFSGLLLTEALFAAAAVTAWALVLGMCDRGRSPSARSPAAAGFMFWMAVMLRPSAAVLVVLAVLAVLFCRRLDRAGLGWAGLMFLVVLVGLAPWALRNRLAVGQWRWLTTRGGISLYDGLRDGAIGASNLAHSKTLPAVQGLSEIEWDGYFRSQALAAAGRDPGRVLRLAGDKFLRTWSLTPNVETYRQGPVALLSAGWMLALLGSAVVGLWVSRRAIAACAVLLLPVLAVTLLHTIFVGSVRYRVPVMPMLMVLSGVGVAWLLERLVRGVRPAGGGPR